MKPLDQHRRASLLQPAAPLTEIHHGPTSRDKSSARSPAAARAVTPFTATKGWTPAGRGIINNQTDRTTSNDGNPQRSFVALLTQAAREYESATLVPPTRTGSSLFSGAGHPLKDS